MEIDGFKAKIQYDPELDQFRGEILGLNGGADFYDNTPAALRREFKRSLKVFLEVCREKKHSAYQTILGQIQPQNYTKPAWRNRRLHSG